jgi:hypothetical protein
MPFNRRNQWTARASYHLADAVGRVAVDADCDTCSS